MFDCKHYVPVLRWKEAERLALRKLGPKVRQQITPLIEITPRAAGTSTAPLNQRLAAAADDMVKDWGDTPLFVDLGLVSSGAKAPGAAHPVCRFFEHGNNRFAPSFIPVTALGRDAAYQSAVRSVVTSDRLGLCLRLDGRELLQPKLSREIDHLLAELGLEHENVDMLVDFGVVTDTMIDLKYACQRIPYLQRWRTFIVVSGAFPKDLTGMDVGRHDLPRRDWQAWRNQVAPPSTLPRLPSFGDFVIAHPVYEEPSPDGGRPNPSASLRYAAGDYWIVMRGEAIYNTEGPGLAQYPAQATLLTGYPEFCGEAFSYGDWYIKEKAKDLGKNGHGRPGNLRSWLQAGINHHLTLTVHQIANLFGS